MGKKLATATVLLLLTHCGGGLNPMMPPGGGVSGNVGPTGGAQNCGAGGSQTATEPNVLDVVVDPGPKDNRCVAIGYTNGLFANVTICVPGTTTCQTIDHLLVDTGSVGVRVLE